ncbi:MAG: DUF4384 domain-containing protein [Candidatus Zixiibacteriota bacterium]
MLKTNKLIMMALIFTLCFSTSLFWGIRSFADQKGGSIIHDYDERYEVSHRVIHSPYLDIEVWVDRGEGATYYPGEEIKVYFRASRDCYVVIYNINTRGYVSLLYPYDRYDDYYVEGGRTYRIPDRFDDYDLTVDGPAGTEYIQAVASFDPISVPNFPGLYDYEGEIYAYSLDGEDPFEFMEDINQEIVTYDYASDVCIFNVEYEHPRWYYWPRVVYVDRPVDVVWGGVYFGYPWGVEVWIDGIFYGITPITIPALVVGRHWVTFWYSGCWIWRDWVWIRRDYTVGVWADCDYRYKYVKERFVEKSYRAEKAKRRRRIGGKNGSTGSPKEGLVKPVDFKKKERLALAEKSRIGETHKYKKELRAKRKKEAVRYKDEKARLKQGRQKVKVAKSQFRAKEKRKIIKFKKENPQFKEKTKIKKKDKISKGKQRATKVKSIRKHETKRAQPVMKKSVRPKAQTKSIIKSPARKSVKVQREHKKRR